MKNVSKKNGIKTGRALKLKWWVALFSTVILIGGALLFTLIGCTIDWQVMPMLIGTSLILATITPESEFEGVFLSNKKRR